MSANALGRLHDIGFLPIGTNERTTVRFFECRDCGTIYPAVFGKPTRAGAVLDRCPCATPAPVAP